MITYTWFCKFEISKALEFETINFVDSRGYHDIPNGGWVLKGLFQRVFCWLTIHTMN